MISAEGLWMRYGSVRALEDATFEVRQGEILGLLGPNGAGKTTTLKILTTALSPSAGRVMIGGQDAAVDPIGVRRRIGYLPESAPLYMDMLVADYLAFVGAARGLAGARLRERREAVVIACGLESAYNRPIEQLSKGFRQRVGIAQALIHDPDILILDEPTSGLDPIQIRGIRDLVRGLARHKTIIFSTHILQEIEAVSDRVLIINEGRIVASGTPAELERQAMGADRLLVEIAGDAAAATAALATVTGVQVAGTAEPLEGGAAFHVGHAFGDVEAPRRVSEALTRAGIPVLRLTHERFTLEQVFVALIRQQARATAAA